MKIDLDNRVKVTFIQSILAITFSLTIAISAVAAPQANLNASRTSGPAPLAVFFDATDTIDTNESIDPFRQLGYSFDFDNSESGSWTHSNLSKNTETGGPLAAHLFDSPGTYQVRLRVCDSEGNHSDASTTITVTDPEAVYSGSDTIVISTGSNFEGAPEGALQIGNATSWPSWESNKRYLLKSGDDFSELGLLRIRDKSDFQIASFGAGPKPIVSNVMIDMDEDNAATPPENGIIQGLDTHSIVQYKMFTNLLIYQNEVIGDGSNINFAAANEWYARNQRGTSSPADWKHPGPIFIVENHVNMQGDPDGPLNGIAGLAHHVAILGNISEEAKEHTLRIFGTYKSVIGHNLFTGPSTDGLRLDIKLMANGINDWPQSNKIFQGETTTETLPNTQFVRIHNNTIGREGSPSNWHIQVAPQDDGNSSTVEGLRDVLIENNTFINGDADNGLERGLQTLGHNIIERGNSYPSQWSSPVQTTSFPSSYSSYSSLYTEFWHGPYYLNDPQPTFQSPNQELAKQEYLELNLVPNETGDVHLNWIANSEYSYQVQYSDTLNANSWQNLGTQQTGSAELNYTHSNSDSSTTLFYRIVETRP